MLRSIIKNQNDIFCCLCVYSLSLREKGIKKDLLLIFFFLLGFALLCFSSPQYSLLFILFYSIFRFSANLIVLVAVRFSDLRLFKTLGGESRERGMRETFSFLNSNSSLSTLRISSLLYSIKLSRD